MLHSTISFNSFQIPLQYFLSHYNESLTCRSIAAPFSILNKILVFYEGCSIQSKYKCCTPLSSFYLTVLNIEGTRVMRLVHF